MSKYKDLKFQIQGEDKTTALFKKLSNNVVSVASKFRSLRLSVANIKTIAISAIGGYFMKSLIDSGDQVQKLNQKLNISTEALSQYKYVAESTGVSFETWANAMQKLSTRVSEAVRGEGKAVEVLKELKIEAGEFSKLKPDEQFEVIADRLLDVSNSADKARIANKLFEEGGVALLQTMEQGSDGLRKMREEAHKLGLTLSKDDVNSMAAFNDALTRLKSSFNGLIQSGVVKLAPSIIWCIDKCREAIFSSVNIIQRKWNDLYNSLDEVLNGFFELEGGMKTVGKGIAYTFEVCCSLVQKSWLAMKMTAVAVFSSLISMIGSSMEMLNKGLNSIGINNSFTEYLKEKGSVLASVNDGLEEYLQSMMKVADYEKISQSFDFADKKDSGIGSKIDFKETTFPDSAAQKASAEELNKLLQLKAQILNELQTPEEKFMERMVEIEQLNQANLITQRDYNRAYEQALQLYEKNDGILTLKEALQSTADAALDLGGIMQKGIGSAIDGLASEITNFVLTGKANFLDLAGSIAKMVLEMTIKLLILKTLMSAFGMTPMGFKKGGIFSGGNNITAFAKGGIVGTPTLFPMSAGRTGLMGEAGPEAVMPLTRGYDGKLGVKLYNKNNKSNVEQQNITNISFNVKSDSPNDFRRSQAQIEADLINVFNRAKRNA